MPIITKVLSFFYFGTEGIVRIAYLLVALAVIAISMYFLGGQAYLNGAWGTDTRSAIGMLVWLDKYFPNIPFWYPLSGGGISLTHSYPVFSLYLSSLLRSLSSLNIIQSFTLIGFSSVLAMAISIYFFAALRFKNQTAGLIASIFYLISPIAWTWLVDWGFYAESVSHIFVGPAIIFWDFFFVSFLHKNFGVRTRLYLLLTVVFLSIAMALHFLEGFALLRFFFFYVLVFPLFYKGERKKVFLKGLTALLLVAVFSYLATLIFSVPFQNYQKISSQVGLSGGGTLKDISQALPGPEYVLGFKTYLQNDFLFAMRRFSFPAIVSLLAIAATVFFAWRDKRMATLGIYAAYAFLLSLTPYYYWYLGKYLPSFLALFVTSGTGWREMFIILRIVLPVLAALAITKFVSLPLFWLKNKYFLPLKNLLFVIPALFIAGYLLYFFANINEPNKREVIYNYGAQKIDIRNILNKEEVNKITNSDRCYIEFPKEIQANFEKAYNGVARWCKPPLSLYFYPLYVADWCISQKTLGIENPSELCSPEKLSETQVSSVRQKCLNGSEKSPVCAFRTLSYEEQIQFKNWPKFQIIGGFEPDAGLNQMLEGVSKEDPRARIDFSPYLSNYSMVSTFYNVNRSLSQLHTYVSTSSLVYRFQGWQQIVFYENEPQYRDPELINNLARWFGINYIFINSRTDASLYNNAGWKTTDHGLKFPEENPLANFSSKPSVLVISQAKLGAYDQVFTVSSLGALPYKDAFLVWGKESIDDYNLEELKQFKMLLLHGYKYKDKGSADKLLTDYVNQGGSVFIDTGWQYSVPDWESSRPLEIIPLNRLEWKNLGKTSDYSLEDGRFSNGVDKSQFGPLIYYGEPWSVSTAERSLLKQEAKVVLSANNYPLIAVSEIGSGKVVWSGMNIFPHSKSSNKEVNKEEIKLLSNLFAWLREGKNGKSFAVSYERPNPDKLEISINEEAPNGGFLLWKEGYYPAFKAKLTENGSSEGLKTYRAGPGVTLIRVSKASKGDRIIYEYEEPLTEVLARFVSFAAFALLILLFFDGFLGQKSFALKLLKLFQQRASRFGLPVSRRPENWLKKSNEDVDY